MLLNPEKYVPDGIVYPKAEWLGSELISKLVKWSTEVPKNEFKSTLSLVSVARYSQVYQDLKEKYKEMVKVSRAPDAFCFDIFELNVHAEKYLLVSVLNEKHKFCS